MTRGERNNNWGNIRVSSQNNWLGKTKNTVEKAFEVFTTPEFGLRALIILLNNYAKQGKDTIREIILTYAPPVENKTTSYINTVAKKVGVNPDAKIDFKDTQQLKKLLQAIVFVELGKIPTNFETVFTNVLNKNYHGSLNVVEKVVKKKAS